MMMVIFGGEDDSDMTIVICDSEESEYEDSDLCPRMTIGIYDNDETEYENSDYDREDQSQYDDSD